ncbi:ras-related protein Rab-24-like isoform X3 [Leptotrombidium deliense]|uniref:Ras-related protein Rab-24-like isoform X3 n=1 Tax=Leptotrombidium deliense TaxID=299467 RepID=A0A443SDS7_9ACAR|nr:ras-related protein Rab-24-like isoform X3 [Leptotrombidium deliense]
MSARKTNGTLEFKLILLGKSAVGKTCLVHRYIHNHFEVDTPNDTAGQERFNAITKFYHRNSNAAIVCVDLTDKESFENMNFWLKQLTNTATNECELYICCTKNDLVTKENIKISSDQIETTANTFKAKVFTTSSKTGEGVHELFRQIINDLINVELKAEEQTIKLTKDELKKKKLSKICCKIK